MTYNTRNTIINSVFLLAVLTTAFIPIYACYQAPKYIPPEIDKAVFERVFLKCVETAKGPNSLTASPNDMDETIGECRYAARQIAEK